MTCIYRHSGDAEIVPTEARIGAARALAQPSEFNVTFVTLLRSEEETLVGKVRASLLCFFVPQVLSFFFNAEFLDPHVVPSSWATKVRA